MPGLVVIPTYNEAGNIEAIVRRVRTAAPRFDVLVVDDASPDGTGALADALATGDPQVHVLHRSGKEGLGAAYVHAFGWALTRDYEVIVQMDADGSHRPEDLPAMLDLLADADVVVGSRWVGEGGVRNWPFHRRLLSRGGSLYARLLLRLPYQDITGGYRAFRRSALEGLHLDDVHSHGYGFQIDMLLRAHRGGHRIVESPIVFVERQVGESKMTAGIVFEAVVNVTRWSVRPPSGVPSRRAVRA